MPLVDTGPHSYPYLVHDAPVTEKTLEVRRLFKIDESGYPEHYKWRALARLGPDYKPEDPFFKFDPYNPDSSVVTKVGAATFLTGAAVGLHALRSWYLSTPFITKSWHIPLTAAGMIYTFLWVHEKTLERTGRKAAVLIDYCQKHPERFGTIHRPKLRELLLLYQPCR